MQEMWVHSLGGEDPLEQEMATHSSILAWKIPWTEEPRGLHTVLGVAKELDTTYQLNSKTTTTTIYQLFHDEHLGHFQSFHKGTTNRPAHGSFCRRLSTSVGEMIRCGIAESNNTFLYSSG